MSGVSSVSSSMSDSYSASKAVPFTGPIPDSLLAALGLPLGQPPGHHTGQPAPPPPVSPSLSGLSCPSTPGSMSTAELPSGMSMVEPPSPKDLAWAGPYRGRNGPEFSQSLLTAPLSGEMIVKLAKLGTQNDVSGYKSDVMEDDLSETTMTTIPYSSMESAVVAFDDPESKSQLSLDISGSPNEPRRHMGSIHLSSQGDWDSSTELTTISSLSRCTTRSASVLTHIPSVALLPVFSLTACPRQEGQLFAAEYMRTELLKADRLKAEWIPPSSYPYLDVARLTIEDPELGDEVLIKDPFNPVKIIPLFTAIERSPPPSMTSSIFDEIEIIDSKASTISTMSNSDYDISSFLRDVEDLHRQVDAIGASQTQSPWYIAREPKSEADLSSMDTASSIDAWEMPTQHSEAETSDLESHGFRSLLHTLLSTCACARRRKDSNTQTHIEKLPAHDDLQVSPCVGTPSNMTSDSFWEHPLGAWIRDCLVGDPCLVPQSSWRSSAHRNLPLEYGELCDGRALSSVYRHIESDNMEVEPGTDARRRFLVLLEHLRRFYRYRLNRVIVMAMPDIMTILRNPTPNESGDELKKLLLLLLGCAVQSDNRKEFVSRITRMTSALQGALASEIQKITEGSSCVVAVSSMETEVAALETLIETKKDEYYNEFVNEHTESDEGSSTTGASSVNGDPDRTTILPEARYARSPSPTSQERHVKVENARLKKELRDTRNELDDRTFECDRLQDELNELHGSLHRMQEERTDLVKKAQERQRLMDDNDALQEKVSKLEKFEKENVNLKQQIFDLEPYKLRSESYKSDYDKLEDEYNAVLRDLAVLRDQKKSQSELTTRLEEYERNNRALQDDLFAKQSEVHQLTLENSRLESEVKQHAAKASEYSKMLEGGIERTPRESFGSLLEEMEDTKRSELLQLKLENKKLRDQLDGRSEVVSPDWLARAKESEKALDDLRDEHSLTIKQLHELEITLSNLNQQYKTIREACDELRSERDDTIKNLQDARKNFTLFQNEFGKKIEEESRRKAKEGELEIRNIRSELERVCEEKEDLERSLNRAKDEQRSTRDVLEELREEKLQLSLSVSQIEREKKTAEVERNAFKEKLNRCEDELEEIRVRLMESGDLKRRVENSERQLAERHSRLGDLEAENRQLIQQLELESKKTQRMREDLVSEKARAADIVSRLRSVCTAIVLHGGKIDKDMDDMKLIDSIDEVIMEALNEAKRESDALRIQQHTQIAELTDLKKDIEKLRRSESASLVESDDRVRELSTENVNIKEQVLVLQEKVREQQIEIASKTSDIAIAQREIQELHKNTVKSIQVNTEVAHLQVSLRNLQLQDELLKKDNAELRKQNEISDRAKVELKKALDSHHALHEALLVDHDRLQNLHDLLTQDYERAKFENQDMKNKLRLLKPQVSLAEYDEMRSALHSERAAREQQQRTIEGMQNGQMELRRDHEALRKENDCLSRNCDALTAEIRRMRLSEQNNKGAVGNMNSLIDGLHKTIQQKDLQILELKKEIEMLLQLNRSLKEDSRELFKQNELLLKENHDLHSKVLQDKDAHYQEQKEFQEKLAALHRHQDRLEGKIMDQYRSLENTKHKQKQPTFVKRTVKALIPKKSRSLDKPSNGSTTEESSAYSADEGVSPPLPYANGDDEVELQPTCSSSEDADRVSPPYTNGHAPSRMNGHSEIPLRLRNGNLGGSVRAYGSPRRTPLNMYDHVSLNGSEREVDVCSPLSSLPPRAPVRGTSISSSLRSRPPPPPYPNRIPRPPPPYPGRSASANQTTSSPLPPDFLPPSASTPKSDRSNSPHHNNNRSVVKEGERRDFIRDKNERDEKAMSIYENVKTTDVRNPNESTVWYEYGCV